MIVCTNIWDTTARTLKSSRANSLLWCTGKKTTYVCVYTYFCMYMCVCMHVCRIQRNSMDESCHRVMSYMCDRACSRVWLSHMCYTPPSYTGYDPFISRISRWLGVEKHMWRNIRWKIYTYLDMYVFSYICLCEFIWCINIYMYMYVYACVYIYIYLYMYTYTIAGTNLKWTPIKGIHVYLYIYACIYICIHTCTRIEILCTNLQRICMKSSSLENNLLKNASLCKFVYMSTCNRIYNHVYTYIYIYIYINIYLDVLFSYRSKTNSRIGLNLQR